jgi:hypothetical protein
MGPVLLIPRPSTASAFLRFDTAAAQQAAWAEILDFLKTHLQN